VSCACSVQTRQALCPITASCCPLHASQESQDHHGLDTEQSGDLQVSGVNYQAYALDSGNAESQQSVLNDLTSGDSSVLSEFQVSKGQEIIFGVAPNRPGPESNPPVATSCAGIERIVDIVCPALRDCSNNKCTYTTYWAFGIMVFDFDTELKLGKFTLVNAAYQALSGHCDSIQKC